VAEQFFAATQLDLGEWLAVGRRRLRRDVDGAAQGFGVLWLNRFGSAGESNVITTVSAAYGTAAFPGNCPPNGTPLFPP